MLSGIVLGGVVILEKKFKIMNEITIKRFELIFNNYFFRF